MKIRLRDLAKERIEARWLESLRKSPNILQRALGRRVLQNGGRYGGKPRKKPFRKFWRRHPFLAGQTRKTRRATARAVWKAMGKG